VAAVAALAAVVLLLVLLRDRAEEARLAGGRERTLAGARATALEDARREAVLRRVCLADLEALRAELEARREAVALLAAPGVRLIRLAPQAAGGGGQAVALIDAAGGRAVLVGHGLAAPAGMDYELWVIRGARKLPAGLLRLDASGALALSVDYTLLADGVDALAVTLEPTGGSPAPTGPIVLLGKAG
jgi:hypothetical protein